MFLVFLIISSEEVEVHMDTEFEDIPNEKIHNINIYDLWEGGSMVGSKYTLYCCAATIIALCFPGNIVERNKYPLGYIF